MYIYTHICTSRLPPSSATAVPRAKLGPHCDAASRAAPRDPRPVSGGVSGKWPRGQFGAHEPICPLYGGSIHGSLLVRQLHFSTVYAGRKRQHQYGTKPEQIQTVLTHLHQFWVPFRREEKGASIFVCQNRLSFLYCVLCLNPISMYSFKESRNLRLMSNWSMQKIQLFVTSFGLCVSGFLDVQPSVESAFRKRINTSFSAFV